MATGQRPAGCGVEYNSIAGLSGFPHLDMKGVYLEGSVVVDNSQPVTRLDFLLQGCTGHFYGLSIGYSSCTRATKPVTYRHECGLSLGYWVRVIAPRFPTSYPRIYTFAEYPILKIS